MNAQLYIRQGVVIVIVTPSQEGRTLQGFALDGTFSFEKGASPKGYCFEYLSTLNSSLPLYVMEEKENNVDAYGRSSWHFAIDTQTGDMTKENRAY